MARWSGHLRWREGGKGWISFLQAAAEMCERSMQKDKQRECEFCMKTMKDEENECKTNDTGRKGMI